MMLVAYDLDKELKVITVDLEAGLGYIILQLHAEKNAGAERKIAPTNG